MEKIIKNKLVWIIIIAIVIRIFGLGLELYSDENIWAETVIKTPNWIVDTIFYIPHPPLAVLSYLGTTAIFGPIPLGFRIMPFIVGILAILVTYLFSKEIYDRKTAIITVSLMAILFYPVWSSLYVDVDGNLLLLFSLLTVFSYFKFSKTEDRKFKFLTGIFLGLAVLSKYSAIILPVILIIYGYLEHRLKSWKGLVHIFLIGVVIAGLFPLSAYLIGSPEIFFRTIGWGTANLSERTALSVNPADLGVSLAKTVTFLFLYGIPLFAILSLYSFFTRKRGENIIFIYLLVFLLFYTFIFVGGIKLRYLMVIIPPIYMLSGKMISDIFGRISKKEIGTLIGLIFIFLMLIWGLNSYGTSENFNSQRPEVNLIFDNAFLWYSGHGSSPFPIHIHSFIFVSVITVILLVLAYGMKFNEPDLKKVMIVLLSLNLAFNFFVISESFNPSVGPNYSETYGDILEYIESEELKEPIYSMVKGIPLFSEKKVIPLSLILDDYNITGTVILIDVQRIGNPSFAEVEGYLFDVCEEKERFISNNVYFGFIFEC